ncbi:flippase [Streptococcus uberis]|uniref:flippase n=1 Tax=Streptococcus uberis TaxID=1349 RepID=UPI002FEBE7A1
MGLKSKSVAKNAILNVIKQICVIIFPMITFPYASRVLGVENFGKFNFGLSLVSYISIIAALGASNYAIREGSRIKEDKKKLNNFVNEIFTLNLISTIFAYLILVILLIFWKKLDNYLILILVQSTVIIFTTLGIDWINSIKEDYFYITLRYIVCQLISLILMFIFVNEPSDYIVYAFVNASATILANISNFYYVKTQYNIKLRFTSLNRTFKHFTPVFIMFGSALATVIYINSDILLLGILKSDVEVGYYSVSVKVYSLVKQVINAIMVVMIPRISFELSKNNQNAIKTMLKNLQNLIFLITLPMISGLFCLSPQIIELFAGKSYIYGTSSLQILSFSLFFAVFANYFVNVILIPYKREKYFLIGTIISALLNILLNIILIPTMGVNAASISTVLSELVLAFIAAYYCRDIIIIKWTKELNIGIITSIFIFFINKLITHFIKLNFIIILSTILFSVLFFCILILFQFRDKLNDISYFRKKF